MSSRRPTKHDVLTAFRRSALLESAQHVFGEQGFENATIEAIARHARVAKGTVYLYYASKRAIYDAAFSACMAELEDVTVRRIEAAASLQDAIAAFVSTRAEYFEQRPDFFRMYVAEVSSQLAGRPSRHKECRAMMERQTRGLQRAIASAVARREIRRVDPTATAMAVFDMTRGLVARHVLSHQRTDARRDVAFLTDLIWTGLQRPRGRQKR